VSARNKSGRTVTRDIYTHDREAYNQRIWIAETPFGLLKELVGLRQFLLRGLEKVQTEWRWACLSLNLDKLVRGLSRLRSTLRGELEPTP